MLSCLIQELILKKRIEKLIKEPSHKNASDQHGFTGEFYQIFKACVGQKLHKLLHSIDFEKKTVLLGGVISSFISFDQRLLLSDFFSIVELISLWSNIWWVFINFSCVPEKQISLYLQGVKFDVFNICCTFLIMFILLNFIFWSSWSALYWE